jgi:hypothetical protein
MPLLIKESDVVTIVVRYVERETGLEFFEEPHEGAIEEKFIFKKPNWKIISGVMIDSLMLSPQGVLAMNPFIFMDKKIKALISDWTLKDSEGRKIPATPENIEKMSPELWEYLNGKLDAYVSSDKKLGTLNKQALEAAQEANKTA